jgi:hypothetical protein
MHRRISLLYPHSPGRASRSATPKRVSASQDENELGHEINATETSWSPRLSKEPLQLPSADRVSVSDDISTHSVDGIYEQHPTPLQQARSSALDRISWIYTLSLTVTQKRVLKCAMAYFLGSLFTYVSTLSEFLVNVTSEKDVPSPIGHLVATM